MKESQTAQKIKKRLPREIHWQSNTGALMSNGTPDKYLDGWKSDLWIEFKQLGALPRNGTVCVAPVPNVKKQPRGHLTPLQRQWLGRRHANGGNAVVIVGLPNGCVVWLATPREWDEGVSIARADSIEEVVRWITKFCMG